MQYVKQKDADGCACACLSMITGFDYGMLYPYLKKKYGRHELYFNELIHELEDWGYECELYRRWQLENESLKSRGCLSIAHVAIAENRAPHHYVIIDSQDKVFDPAFEDGKIARYAYVGYLIEVREYK